MVHPRKISTPEVRVNESFFIVNFFYFWFRPLFGKMIAVPPRAKQLQKNLGLWSTQQCLEISARNALPGTVPWSTPGVSRLLQSGGSFQAILQQQFFAGKQIPTNDFTCSSQGRLLQQDCCTRWRQWICEYQNNTCSLQERSFNFQNNFINRDSEKIH